MKSDSSLARTLLHPPHHLQAVRQESAKQIGFPSPSWPISTLLFELLIERSFSPAREVKVSEHFSLACGSWRSCSLSLAQSLHPSQCGHSPMQELRLSKQQSLGKFALAKDYVNYHGIITSLKQAEINYLWWNECKMRKYWWGQKKRREGGEIACQRKWSHCAPQSWSLRGTAVQHNMTEQVGSTQRGVGAT